MLSRPTELVAAGERSDAATRLHDKQALATEVAALEADEEDRAEMLAVADLMESLRAPG